MGISQPIQQRSKVTEAKMNAILAQPGNKEAEQLIEIIRYSPLPLSTRELGVRLRLGGRRDAGRKVSY